jgi:hypothetical protein
MSGFTITLDAILAMIMAALLVASVGIMLSSKEEDLDDQLVQYGYDFLAVAEKSGALGNVVDFDTADFRELISSMPYAICINASMYMQDGTFFYHADNFQNTSSPDYYISKCKEYDTFVSVSRMITHGDEVYPITLKLWYG